MESVANQKTQKPKNTERKKDHKIFSIFFVESKQRFCWQTNKRPFIFSSFLFFFCLQLNTKGMREEHLWKQLDSVVEEQNHLTRRFTVFLLPLCVFVRFFFFFCLVFGLLLFSLCFFLQIDFSAKFVLGRNVWMLSPTTSHLKVENQTQQN